MAKPLSGRLGLLVRRRSVVFLMIYIVFCWTVVTVHLGYMYFQPVQHAEEALASSFITSVNNPPSFSPSSSLEKDVNLHYREDDFFPAPVIPNVESGDGDTGKISLDGEQGAVQHVVVDGSADGEHTFGGGGSSGTGGALGNTYVVQDQDDPGPHHWTTTTGGLPMEKDIAFPSSQWTTTKLASSSATASSSSTTAGVPISSLLSPSPPSSVPLPPQSAPPPPSAAPPLLSPPLTVAAPSSGPSARSSPALLPLPAPLLSGEEEEEIIPIATTESSTSTPTTGNALSAPQYPIPTAHPLPITAPKALTPKVVALPNLKHSSLAELRQLRSLLPPRSGALALDSVSAEIEKELNIRRPMTDPAVVVFTFNRTDILRECLNSLLRLPESDRYTIYVAQDGDVAAVSDVIREYVVAQPNVRHIQRDHIEVFPNQKAEAYITQHYKFVLDELLLHRQGYLPDGTTTRRINHSHLVLVEDDMVFAPDFLRLFEESAWLLEADPTLWCISSWNDNGHSDLDLDSSKLFRSSFFPGLGWLLRRQLWEELSPIFPRLQWDHWMRANAQGRDCVSPEVSRNFNQGIVGAHMGASSFEQHLLRIKPNTDAAVEFGDLSYLLEKNYAKWAEREVLRATAVPYPSTLDVVGRTYLIPYTSLNAVSDYFGIWESPRSHFRHTTFVSRDGVHYILADQRLSPFLPLHLRIEPHPSLKIFTSYTGESCSEACARRSMSCEATQFPFINDCTVLRQKFACERGCAMSWDEAVPGYKSGKSTDNSQRCVVANRDPFCDGWHQYSRRLCPCVDTVAW